jgi:parallel beta-helix repeat protein
LGEQRTALILLLILSAALFSFPEIKITKADNTHIYIRADGSIEGTDKIQRKGDIYTFIGDVGTDDWSYGITVERDGIAIDGGGYLLKGHGQLSMIDIFAYGKPVIHGINLDGRKDVTIRNLHIWGFNCGFWANSSQNIKIVDNNLTEIATNIIFQESSNNIISGNTMVNGGTDGIYFYKGHYNTITNNYIQDTINGIHVYQSSSSTISDNKITKNTNGIYLDEYSLHNLISGNILENNSHGIGIGSSFYNTITRNYIANNSHSGIWLAGRSANNTITENNLTNNADGVYIREADYNNLFNNNFINNTRQVWDLAIDYPDHYSLSRNFWDNDIMGNYWSNYNGTDSNGDGIGDIPYIIDENSQDNFPLMEPITIPEFPSVLILVFISVGSLMIVLFKKKFWRQFS